MPVTDNAPINCPRISFHQTEVSAANQMQKVVLF